MREAYKKVSNSFMLEIKEQYINERVKNKWSRICEYYNEASWYDKEYIAKNKYQHLQLDSSFPLFYSPVAIFITGFITLSL